MALKSDVKAAAPAHVVHVQKRKKETRTGKKKKQDLPEVVPKEPLDLYRPSGRVEIKLALEPEPRSILLFTGPTRKQYEWLRYANQALCVAEFTSSQKCEEVPDVFFYDIERNLEELRIFFGSETALVRSFKRKVTEVIHLLQQEVDRLNEVLQEKI